MGVKSFGRMVSVISPLYPLLNSKHNKKAFKIHHVTFFGGHYVSCVARITLICNMEYLYQENINILFYS